MSRAIGIPRKGDTVTVHRTFADGRSHEWSGVVVSCSPMVSSMGGHGIHFVDPVAGSVHLWVGSDSFATTTVVAS